jgi:hypothetical protein
VGPTVAPTGTPTKAPTATPTKACVDSPLRLKINRDGNQISRYCSWVAQKDTNNRCALDGVSAACPITCGTCSTCEDPVDSLRFKFTYNGSEIVRNCDFIGRVPGKEFGRCNQSGNICRSLCGTC